MIAATGLTGSIGRHMVGVLPLNLRFPCDQREIEGSLRTLSPETLIHLAAVTSQSEVNSSPTESRKVNVEAAISLMNAFIITGGRRFIFASTGHVYGPQEWGHISTESDSPNPVSLYAQQKLDAETALIEMADASGVELIITRIFSIFGPDVAKHYLPGMVAAAIGSHSPLPKIRFADDVRDFSSPKSVAIEMMKLSGLSDSKIDIFNIATGIPLSVMDRVLMDYPNWPLELFERDTSSLPWLVGSPTKLKKRLEG